MRRLILATLATVVLAVPTIGQAAPAAAPSVPRSHAIEVDWKKPTGNKSVVQKKVVKKKVVRKDDRGRHAPQKYDRRHDRKHTAAQWRHGQRYHDWRRHQAVRDYHRYHLRRPAAGQEWIRVGNDYLLVGIATGIIASIVAAH